jgi:putative drug exporter of the RND superfamily
VVLGWLVGLVVLAAGGSALAGQYDAEYSTPGSESDDAARLIDERFGGASSSETIDVVWEAPGGATRPDIKRRIDDFTRGASDLEGIYLQGMDPGEIITAVRARRAPMMSASAGLRL